MDVSSHSTESETATMTRHSSPPTAAGKVPEMTYLDLLRVKEIRQVSLPLWAVWGLFGFTYYGLILFVGRLYTTTSSGDDDKSTGRTCSFDYSSIFINATSEMAGVTVSALAIDRLGRVRTQSYFYLAAAAAVAVMGMGLPASAVLVVSIIGRMSIMAASVSAALLRNDS